MADVYLPQFSPWLDAGFQKRVGAAASRSLVSLDRIYILQQLAVQAMGVDGCFMECGVYRGGTARFLADLMEEQRSPKHLLLFDTFDGMPQPDPGKDWHKKGDFGDVDLDDVTAFVGHRDSVSIYPGRMPETFAGCGADEIALAHIDVDIYRSVMDCLGFVYPRMANGGFIVIDDYGFPTCKGAKIAVDEFFAGKRHIPICLPTGQAVIIKV